MKSVNKIKLDLLKLKKGERVLDVGCSEGLQAIEIAKQRLIVYGVDPSKEQIAKFKKRAKVEKVNCIALIGSVEKLKFKNNFFDAVISTEVFEHIPNLKKAINECYRVLKPGGRICVSIPTKFSEDLFKEMHPYWVKDSTHVNFLSKKEMREVLEEAGFKVEKVEQQNFEWSIFWVIHSLLESRFDFTGTPVENKKVTDEYLKIWSYLFKYRVANIILRIGNIFFPKSYYFYAVK